MHDPTGIATIVIVIYGSFCILRWVVRKVRSK